MDNPQPITRGSKDRIFRPTGSRVYEIVQDRNRHTIEGEVLFAQSNDDIADDVE